MESRESLTLSILNSLWRNDVFFLQLPTGYGKSLMAITIQEALVSENVVQYTNGELSRELHPFYPKTLIFIARKVHKQNWINEYKKYGYNVLLHDTTFSCYNSLHKFQETKWDLIICDEAHNLSPNRLQSLSTISFEKAVFLSATLKKSVMASLEWMFNNKRKISFKETVDNAIAQKILPEPKIFIHQLKLNNVEEDEEIIINGKSNQNITQHCRYKNRWGFIKDNAKYKKLIIYCTQQEKYEYLSEQVEYWKNKFMYSFGSKHLKLKWLRSALDRKNYFAELKTGYAQTLLKEIPESKRIICFCNSINQADKLGGTDNIIHSKVKFPLAILNRFQNKLINQIYCVGMLNEGMNLEGIEAGIIVQLDNELLSWIQRLGRILRADSPVVNVLVYKNTRDEEYLEKVLENIDSKYVKILNSNK